MLQQDRESQIESLIQQGGRSLFKDSIVHVVGDTVRGFRSGRRTDFRLGEAVGFGLWTGILSNLVSGELFNIFAPGFAEIINTPRVKVTIPELVPPVLAIIAGVTARQARIGRAIRIVNNRFKSH